MIASIEAPLALFKEPVEVVGFDAADVVLTVGKHLGVVDAQVVEVQHIECVVGLECVGVDDGIRCAFPRIQSWTDGWQLADEDA